MTARFPEINAIRAVIDRAYSIFCANIQASRLKECVVKTKIMLLALAAAIVVLTVNAQQRPAQPVSIGATDVGGTVTSPNGAEAGVWVIAETDDLPTKFAKMVVTDDRGRYVIPELPKATYNVWVRGYGLVDSPKAKITPGQHL